MYSLSTSHVPVTGLLEPRPGPAHREADVVPGVGGARGLAQPLSPSSCLGCLPLLCPLAAFRTAAGGLGLGTEQVSRPVDALAPLPLSHFQERGSLDPRKPCWS